MTHHGDISAWHVATRQPVCLRWEHGRIASLGPASETPPPGLWLAPVLVDLQVNGYAGIDFQQDGVSLESLVHATRRLRAAGCGSWLLTLITDAWPAMMARLRHLRRLRSESDELQRAIAGWHIEGPFLSDQPGFCGAHDAAWMRDPPLESIDELRDITGDDPVLLTLAPERPGALEAIRRAVSLGLRVSLGHTDASQARLAKAVAAGASGFTHLGNGCPGELNRHDNILWRVFETPGLIAGVIPDKAHVSPALFRLIHRTLGRGSVYYITDAMAAAGAPPGRYALGRLELDVGPDQVVRLPGKPNFAGSALRPIDGVFRAAEMLGCPWQEVWRGFSETPARLMRFPWGLEVGAPADFCCLECSADNRLQRLDTFIAGKAAED